MQLTNYGFLESRGNYLAARANHNRSMERLSTGLKINSSHDDAGALGVVSRTQAQVHQNAARRNNLQNFVSYLDTQREGLEHVRRIYERVNVLAHGALDLTKSRADREILSEEFQELKEELEEILGKKFNGTRLFGGKFADFSDGLEDLGGRAQAPEVNTTFKEVTKDVGTTAGKLELKFSTGVAPDQLTVYQGSDIIFQTGPWRTYGSSHVNNDVGRKDTFTLEFAPHCPTVVTLEPHAENVRLPAPQDTSDPKYPYGLAQLQQTELEKAGLFFTREAPGTSTEITIRAENMGNNASYLVDAVFEPELPANDLEVPVGSAGEASTYSAVAFGRLGCLEDINTATNAQQALAALKGDLDALGDGLAGNAAARNRYVTEIDSLERGFIAKERALGVLEDAGMAREATQLAKQSMKMKMAANVMSRATRLADVLMPLATQRHGGGLTSSSLI